MRVAMMVILGVLLHIIGIPFHKFIFGVVALVMLWNLPDIIKQGITRKWRW